MSPGNSCQEAYMKMVNSFIVKTAWPYSHSLPLLPLHHDWVRWNTWPLRHCAAITSYEVHGYYKSYQNRPITDPNIHACLAVRCRWKNWSGNKHKNVAYMMSTCHESLDVLNASNHITCICNPSSLHIWELLRRAGRHWHCVKTTHINASNHITCI